MVYFILWKRIKYINLEFKKIIPPKDRFYADPFLIEFDNYYIFIEELMYNTKKGHISVIKMDDQGNYDRPKKL